MTIDDLNVQFDSLQEAVAAEQKRVTDDINKLKAQVAAGTPVTQAQLDALGARFAAVTESVSKFDINTPDAPVIAPTPAV